VAEVIAESSAAEPSRCRQPPNTTAPSRRCGWPAGPRKCLPRSSAKRLVPHKLEDYCGNSHGSTALAAHPATNARGVATFQRRGTSAVGAAVGAPAAGVYYAGSTGYLNY
jgi:hypothetical protein